MLFLFYFISFLYRFAFLALKKLRFIFVFVFLAGMIFTVFQYIPLLEEETHGHKTELTKKVKQGNLSDGDGDSSDEDSDNDDDSEQEFNYYYSDAYTYFHLSSKQHFSNTNNLYKYLLEHKDTPPPKV